ncbi:MAG TPA: VWA domain-containing protein [Gemmatimonadaceae bacterium]|nr:VWA domain-containing protein [Gemmatimonadaceae bacterium]
MSFLAPFALVLAAAASVPLVLHLLRRRTGEKVDFPAIRYLLRAEREHSRQLKLRNLLLMLLRVFAVIALALAAARPIGRFAGGSHAPTAMAIVLDNSLSTSVVVNGAPVLAKLKDAARSAIGRANASDRLWLVTADSRVVGGSASAVRAALDRADALGGAGDLRAAVARAAQLVRGGGLPSRQLAIVTDGQATSWASAVPLDGVATTVYAPSLATPKNRAVISAQAEPPHWTPRGAVRATTTATDSVTFRVALGARAAARGIVAPGEDIVVRLAPADRGWLPGSVELEPDELRGDDVRWFAVHIGPAPAVSVVAGTGAFASTAVDALAQDGRVARGGDILIGGAESAKRPGVFFAPTDPVQLGAANRALERAGIPWKFGALRTGPAPVTGAGLAGVSALRWYALSPRTALEPGTVDTLANVGSDPWAVAGDGYVLVASPLATEGTDLPLRASWVPWLGSAIADHLSGDAGSITEAAPGANVARPAWAHELEEPDGNHREVTESRFPAPDRPGVYFWLRGTQRAGALVVNPEVGESDLTRLSVAQLEARFSGAEVVATDNASRWVASAFSFSGRRALDSSFLVLGLLLLAAEAVVTRAIAPKGD